MTHFREVGRSQVRRKREMLRRTVVGPRMHRRSLCSPTFPPFSQRLGPPKSQESLRIVEGLQSGTTRPRTQSSRSPRFQIVCEKLFLARVLGVNTRGDRSLKSLSDDSPRPPNTLTPNPLCLFQAGRPEPRERGNRPCRFEVSDYPTNQALEPNRDKFWTMDGKQTD